MHTINYDNITQTMNDFAAAPNGDIALVFPKQATIVQLTIIGLAINDRLKDGYELAYTGGGAIDGHSTLNYWKSNDN